MLLHNEYVKVIASSSKGNAYIYNNLLVDVGVPFSYFKGHMKGVQYIFISHKHTDHLKINTLKKILETYNIRTIFCGYDVDLILKESGITNTRVISHKDKIKLKSGEILEFFEVPHDPGLTNHGVKIKGKYNIIHVTDCGDISHVQAYNYDFACIECNYKENKINLNMDKASVTGERFLFNRLVRVKRTHLAEHQYLEFLRYNNISNSYPAHRSDSNY